MIYSTDTLKKELEESGLRSDDRLMVHSSFSSVKNIENGVCGFLQTFKEYFDSGLLLFPSHTWASMKEDGAIMHKSDRNSCVGYLTNAAIADIDGCRSNHPTHSVVAFGHGAKHYVSLDDGAQTPVSPKGCFGELKKGGKILFIGCPLSKNTFVHSIEEEMNVPDRFTEHIYTFFTDTGNGLMEFHMPRHFSSLNPHISDNYEKLLPRMIKKGIAQKVTLLDSISYLVDAEKLYEDVLSILKKDLHAFDDLRDIESF